MKSKSGKNSYKSNVIVLILTLVIVLTLCSVGCRQSTEALYSIKELQVTDEDSLALQTYPYEALGDKVVTMRADTMYITQRGLNRAQPDLLSDEYVLTTDYGSRSIEFTDYPSPSSAINADMFLEEAAEMGVDSDVYFIYYKYMLLSQGYNLINEAVTASQAGTMSQDTLRKHPAADDQYGEVVYGDNAVEKVIILDPTYRSMHVTGLYLPAGEAVNVKIEGLGKNEAISFNVNLHNSLAFRGTIDQEAVAATGATPTGEYFTDSDIIASSGDISTLNLHNQSKRQNSRLPFISADFEFSSDGEYKIGTPFGGILSINPRTAYSAVKITITGAVETPHYILGVTTPEYFEKYLKTAPGVYSVLDTENGQLIGPASAMRKVSADEIDSLAMLWHSFFAVNETFTGGTYDRKNLVKFDIHVPAGAAVALGGYVYACPSSWYNSAMDYEGLLKKGNWGILHEIGHNHGSAFGSVWGFAGSREGEVRNNALTCLAYLKLLDIGTYRDDNGSVSAEHGFVAHAYSNLLKTLNISSEKADFNDYDYFEALSMYVNIMHSFGTDKFYELLHSYSDVPSYIEEGTVGNKRSDFAYRCALVYGNDFRQYFNVLYKAGLSDEMFSEEQLAKMNSLTAYQPIANLYAGGIDGVHTGGDYRINYGMETTFDLLGKTISSGSFEIINVNQPRQGTLSQNDDGTWRYHFGNNTYLEDEFTFTVLLENGEKHTLKVSLRVNPHISSIEHYTGLSSRTLDDALLEIQSQIPVLYSQAGAGVADYTNSDAFELKISRFIFRADQDGTYTFYLNADDLAILQFGNDFDSLEEKIRITAYMAAFNDTNSFEVELEKGQSYAICVINLNTGGKGKAGVGYKVGDMQKATALPASMIYSSDFGANATDYTFVPKFIISKKSGLVLGTLSSEKSEWEILEAPDSQGGNTETQELCDDGGVIVIEKATYLIDGQKNTIYHTVWSGGVIPPMPHVFVLDTGKLQAFNFFEISTRNNVNSYIHEYELQISDDGNVYKEVSSGEKLTYSGLTARLEFPEITGRFWKLIVKSTSGGRFTVISELDTGVSAVTQQVLPLTSQKLFSTKGWENSQDLEGIPVGRMVTSNKNEKLVMRFYGERISLFGDKGDGFGRADVYIDGKHYGVIDLNSKEAALRQLVFSCEGLKTKEHTVEIITLTNNQFRLAFAGLSYSSTLLNATNIYKEKALTTALIVFVSLFAILAVFVILSFVLPKFRRLVFQNKLMENFDKKQAEKGKQKKKDTAKDTPLTNDQKGEATTKTDKDDEA